MSNPLRKEMDRQRQRETRENLRVNGLLQSRCKRCAGTGKFRNYLGYAVAQCAACHGTGMAK